MERNRPGRTRMDIVNDALEELRQKYPTLFTSDQYTKRVVGVLNRYLNAGVLSEVITSFFDTEVRRPDNIIPVLEKHYQIVTAGRHSDRKTEDEQSSKNYKPMTPDMNEWWGRFLKAISGRKSDDQPRRMLGGINYKLAAECFVDLRDNPEKYGGCSSKIRRLADAYERDGVGGFRKEWGMEE